MTCYICDLDATRGARSQPWIHRDDLFIASVLPGLEIPGWVVLRTRAHREGWEGLRAVEATAIGPLLRDLAAAVREACGASRVYQAVFGDNHPHFHTLVAAAMSAEQHHGPAYLLQHRDRVDVPAAMSAAESIRQHLEPRRLTS